MNRRIPVLQTTRPATPAILGMPPFLRWIGTLGLAFFLQSCYSVKISNVNGSAEPDPMNTQMGFYNGKQVIVIDTVVNLSLLQNGVLVLERCPSGGFHSLEYKVSLGSVLLNAFTFGKRKKVQVKCVCLKDTN
jgi:hypothetical protein